MHAPTGGDGLVSATDDNKALVRRFIDEVLNQGNLDSARELLAPDFVLHHPMLDEPAHGAEGYKKAIDWFDTVFPDFQTTIDFLVAEGDMVASRWTVNATHTGPFGDIAATGKHVTYTGIAEYRVRDGKIVEGRIQEDLAGILQQIGAVPATA
jgi:steroid delta-isomerase-like uncharacterized protein